MKRLLSLNLMVFMVLLMLSGCGHTHEFEDATCTEPKICKVCGETDGKALGHDWQEANCENPKTCKRCGETEGEALGHSIDIGLCNKCGKIVNRNSLKAISDFIMEADSYITSATNEMKSADLSSSVDMYNKYITAQEYLTKGKVYFKSASTLCDIYPNGTKSFSKKLENVIAKIPSNVYGSSYDDLINYMNDCADMLRSCQDLYDEMSSFTSFIAKGE